MKRWPLGEAVPRAMKRLGLSATLVLILALAAGSAQASQRQVSIFQDDALLLYQPPARVAHTLAEVRGLGAEVLRVMVTWRDLAPAPDSSVAPSLRSLEDPAAYPAAGWQRYDTLVLLAKRFGLRVDLDLSSPAPDWAGGAPPTFPTDGPVNPSSRLFAAFVHAVGVRYRGGYRSASGVLPRVSFWSIWNEPNQAAWLRPQWSGRPATETSARLYRRLARLAWRALRAAGHARDTILIGELAPAAALGPPGPEVNMAPLRFLRALYCVDSRLRSVRGAAAVALGCPAGGGSRSLRAGDPELFAASGLAVHPYAPSRAPEVPAPARDWIGPADLGRRLGSMLDRIYAHEGIHRRVPVYVTEFGYKTHPNPSGVTLGEQAAYLNRAELLGFRDPRVRSWAQFLLIDQPPMTTVPRGDPARWATFQSGLRLVDGQAKPALTAYRLAFVVLAPAQPGVPVPIWGHVRPYRPGDTRALAVQIAGRPGRRFRTLMPVRITNPEGFLSIRVPAPAGARLRLAWRGPGGRFIYSRVIQVQAALRG